MLGCAVDGGGVLVDGGLGELEWWALARDLEWAVWVLSELEWPVGCWEREWGACASELEWARVPEGCGVVGVGVKGGGVVVWGWEGAVLIIGVG